MLNSPLRKEACNQRAAVIPQNPESSMLDYGQFRGSFMARDVHESTVVGKKAKISNFLGGEYGFSTIEDDEGNISIDKD
ncbi:DUF3134 domain-containing protein [Anabaena cylindrica FACHB-243]|uniref:Uncharacterized protein n=1 Tax=Anabaena cylindrica (strain ATCC 27899 / PCC 7122) TaxID=272123 RepID=K9ZD25_ANACC|nr:MULTISPECIES: DUF3134 family protein [Anabaena]AFZ57086.1 hypothetical protein Anacy_1583 [Anabaena cylindrica PCC 7122]MBD2421438.1 DUF3134 domain-containing protein [Anabaena cylindrica FACHB-243]MBY5283149.1 DUF3134 family protein [Anabaena sp. CCAP 1446/1C]MBY5309131.1 DUF3134 family protein [Anabaena sp. CCAP 1446/1C]MCM2407801.1 DUF3134 domain-containing protein [Anabaena sp. CCAP 1446/1C]